MIALTLIMLISIQTPVSAQPVSVESLQMQRLITTAEAQLKSIRELLKASNQDAKSLDAASHSLEKLTAGLEKSVAQFQGTKEYQDALLQLQSDAGSKLKPDERQERFQKESVRANLVDLDEVKKLSSALKTAEPGFVPKIAAEAQLGAWQSNARISAQLTEVVSELRTLQSQLGGGKGTELSGLAALIRGSEMQNEKQKEATARGLH
jgi:hypothetical protein